MTKHWVSGWERFAFIVTPAELEKTLQDMHLLITGRHVPIGYTETALCEYMADYSRIYNKLRSGMQLEPCDIGSFREIGFAKSLQFHAYSNEHTYRGKKYILPDFDEPCAMLEYFPLHIEKTKDGADTLTIRASSIQFPEQTVGLTLSFPKHIRYASSNDYLPQQSTKDLDSYQDFAMLRNRIKAITQPLRIIVSGKGIRPRIRISQAALADINGFWFLKKNGISGF